MSILIKGMSLPEDGCHHMVCIYSNGVVVTNGGNWIAEELPPHGDLIERDKLVFEDDYYGWRDKQVVKGAPTVIPADADEERREYDAQVEAAKYCEMYEQTYDPETGAM